MSRIYSGDCLDGLKEMEDCTIQCCVTSPPYWGLRDYGHSNQMGLEKTHEEYVEKMVRVFREVRRVLKDDGTLWLNLGDSYANTKVGDTETRKNKRAVTATFKKRLPPNLKQKDLVGIPWRVAFALQADGWYLRQDIIWAKPNPMPESVTDRCTKSHEYLFLLTKSAKYFYDHEAIKEPAKYAGKTVKTNGSDGMVGGYDGFRTRDGFKSGRVVKDMRNKRSVWSFSSKPFKGAHFAVMPEALVEPCIKAGTKPGDIVLDPFFGAGTVGVVAKKLGRDFVGIELNKEYCNIAEKRISSILL